MKFLQWPIIIIGVSIMVVSLAGFAGACYRNIFLMYLYLWAMFIIIAALIGFIIFAYAVTGKGSGQSVLNRAYKDYSFQDYSGTWLADRVSSRNYWSKISSCIRDSHVCRKMQRHVNGVPETAEMFYLRKLSSIQLIIRINQLEELDQYLKESLLPRVHEEFDVVGWWKVNRMKYSTLSKMARDILSIPVCTVPAASVFDTVRKEMDSYRCSLRPETVEALICAKDWLQMESVDLRRH